MTQVCDTFSRVTSGDWGVSEIPNAVWEQQRGALSTDGSKAIAITSGSFNRATSNLSFSGVPYSSSDFPIEFQFKTVWPSGSGFLELDFSPTTNPFDLAISKAAASTTVNANVEGGSDTPVITGFTGGLVNVHLVVTDTQTTLAVWTTGSEPAPQITQSHASGTYNPSNWDFLSLTFFGSSASDEFDTDDFCITYGPAVVTHTQTFTLDSVVAGLGPPANPPITPSTVVITVGGNDITDNVIFADAEFTAAANGQAGTCSFRVRDLTHSSSFVTGTPITLDIDSVREWTGYIMQIKRGYFFDVEATNCRCASVPRYFQIIGSDLNVLFQKRFLFDAGTPTKIDLTHFPAGTPDKTVIEYYAAHHLDLSGDSLDTTSLVQHVGTPSTDVDISAAAGWSWGQFMEFVNFNIGAVYYLNPDRKLVWADDETETAPFVISDRPTGGQVGYSEYEDLNNGSDLINDALVWGAGLGSDSVVFSRSTDATSVSTHGRWQVGTGLLPIYKQVTADRTSSTYVYGSPQNHRGHKDDAIGIKCVVYRSGLRVAQVIRVISTVYNTDITLPIRTCRITFLTQHDPKWELGIASQYDMPWMGFDFFPFSLALPPFPPFDFIPQPQPANPCHEICTTCGWGAFSVSDPYHYATLNSPLSCWPYSVSAQLTIPGNGWPGSGTMGGWAQIGIDAASPPAINSTLSVELGSRISGGAFGGDIPIGTPFCQINSINGQGLGGDNSLYAVPGTIGIPGPYSVLVEMVPYFNGVSNRIHYSFNGILNTNLDAADPQGLGGAYHSVYKIEEDTEFAIGSASVDSIFISGCPALVSVGPVPSSACLDEFDRTANGNWGGSPIFCLPWQASSHGSHSDDGAVAHQSSGGVIAGEEATDWLSLTAWTGTPLEFLTKVRTTAGSSTTIAILIGRQTGTAADGPVFDVNPVYRWEIAFGTNVQISVLAKDDQGLTASSSFHTGPTGISGAWVWVRCRLEQDHIRGRIWKDGTTEPGTWTAEAGGVFINPFHFLLGLGNSDLFAYRNLFSAASSYDVDRLEFISGLDCSGPCADPCSGLNPPQPDPASGYACLNLTHIDPPPGYDTNPIYYSTGSGFPGNSYQSGSSEVRYDGLFLRNGLDYTEDYVNGLIAIINPDIVIAFGQHLDQTHIVWGCFFFMPIAVG